MASKYPGPATGTLAAVEAIARNENYISMSGLLAFVPYLGCPPLSVSLLLFPTSLLNAKFLPTAYFPYSAHHLDRLLFLSLFLSLSETPDIGTQPVSVVHCSYPIPHLGQRQFLYLFKT